jgi:hypothetical protein
VDCKKTRRRSKDTFAVNIKTKEILALNVTDEKVHDGKVMKNLVEGVLNNNHDIEIKSFIGDGAYNSNENFKYLKEKRIRPIIKIKRNSIVSSKNINVRNRGLFKQRIITNGKRKESMNNDEWVKKQHFLL